jgi:DNA polymerase-3 subunit delta'
MAEIENTTLFSRVVGQNRIKELLASSVEKSRLAHAYLFSGPPGVGKDALAISMALGLNCQNQVIGGCRTCASCSRALRLENPAFHFIYPVPTRPKFMKEEKYQEILRERILARIDNPYKPVSFTPEMTTLPIIGIDQIRAAKQESRLMLFKKGIRIFLISQAEKMTVPAANSLLKLLEEPPEDTVIFLTTTVSRQLLSTIVSRCQQIQLDMLVEKDIIEALTLRWNVAFDKAQFLAKMSGGSLQRALELFEGNFEQKREYALELLEAVLQRDTIAQLDTFDSFLKNVKKPEVQDIFQMLLMLLRDLRSIRSGLTDRLLNADCLGKLQDFNRKHPDLDLDKAAQAVFRAIDFVQKNVYLPLILHSLDQQFKH